MRLESLIAALLVLSQISSPAAAQPRDGSQPPQFSAAEKRTVNRNELLRALIAGDPLLVREFLDAVALRNATNSDEFIARALEGIDRAKNPDIVSSTRTAAASIEWIELLRRARDEKEAIGSKPRTAEGSLHLIETIKKVKQEKGTAK